MSNQLSILNSQIRILDGLYSLNDLHLVSGNDPKHRPSLFARNEQTKDLILEIESSNNERSTKTIFALKTIRGGADISKQGTWACEELALAYATWISPKFHLVVLRAFIAMHKGELQNQQQTLPLASPKADEEALQIITRLYHALAGGYELSQLLHKAEYHHLRKQIDNELGGHYIHNLYRPTENALSKAKKYIHAKSERIMYIKGMLSLLNEPLALR